MAERKAKVTGAVGTVVQSARHNSVSFRLGPPDEPVHRGVTSRLSGGMSEGAVTSRDLEGDCRLIDRTIQGMVFSVAEASAIVDACNGTLWDSYSLFDGLALGLEDAISGDGLDGK